MPNLLIAPINGVWTAMAANSGTSYVFQTIGGTQEIALQQLASAMEQGAGALVNGIEEIFEIPNGVDAAMVVTQLFEESDMMTFVARIIYGAIAPDVIIDDLALAGQALMEAVAAL